jgi:hypothetical protein
VSAKIIILFPYSGYEKGDLREGLFWKLVDCSRKETQGQRPIVILNKDTEIKGKAKAFIDNQRSKSDVEIYRCWAVDTCQMWLAGWGYVIDKYENGEYENSKDDRLVQIPGDIDKVSDREGHSGDFFRQLGAFINRTGPDVVIGDFASEDKFSAKELIDLYGTYALMANWFPDVAQACRRQPLELNKLRSEFLNIKTETLKDMLKDRKFAYEQTLNMIIRSWDFDKNIENKKDDGFWKYNITKIDLGVLKDDIRSRQYRDCLDQIERTERMLKMLWREFNEVDEVDEKLRHTDPQQYDIQYQAYKNKYQEYIDLYDRLDRRSTSIRENSRIIIRNILGLGPQ